jgi:hypothetical protein
LNRATVGVIVAFLHGFFTRKGPGDASERWESSRTADSSAVSEGTKGLWCYDVPADKRVCPFRGVHCGIGTFGSYRQMLAHCRQKHPDRLPLGGDETTELVVTDIQGKALSWEEMRQIIDDPSFWREPQGIALSGEPEEIYDITIPPGEGTVASA